ncbi:universal stress protein [Exilibacterium tricleocarpae]|uniref:Universal stress protein n=1 Tax=Exilibacterium tricleocarpae TaxID=2591008 RepID=A0A545T8A7_9GAMM|nr:universal stress protein [Exilibacterium tricleocarpae]TQV73428.1 universal stress protein [Exilibacterium tricleocarpae]
MMPTYHCLVCAVDLTADANRVVRHSLQLVQQNRQKLHLIHACEHPITGYGELTGNSHLITESQIRRSIYPYMETLSKHHDIPVKNLHIEFGRPAAVIHALAATLAADLIVIGSHGRSGIRAWLGSTANSVLHGANCDVLTVRIKEN